MGMTLYTYDKDEKGKTNCYDKCATNWPPLKAEAGAKADDEWTIVDRTDGTKMWAYDGKPVYTFIKDKKAGDVTGDGVGEVWPSQGRLGSRSGSCRWWDFGWPPGIPSIRRPYPTRFSWTGGK